MEKGLKYRYDEIVLNVRNIVERINIEGICLTNYPLDQHTTFKVGGPAELCIRPKSVAELQTVLKVLYSDNIRPQILGGGANVVISDKGLDGVVILTDLLVGIRMEKDHIIALAGTPVSDVCEYASENSLSGLEFIYRMPGTVGGAVWMNARCYGSSIADVINWVEYFDTAGTLTQKNADDCMFDYKKSVFQENPWLITSCAFNLSPGDKDHIVDVMKKNEEDRYAKGHFKYPCAGSAFKNNRKFGKPTGQIIDGLGLKGMRIGGAQVAPFHGNIIVNTGNATAADVHNLVTRVREHVYRETGFDLEPEIVFLGF